MMGRRITTLLSLAILLTEFFCGVAFAAPSGTVEGSIRDAQTNEPLPGANVLLVGTSLGASTDLNGKFLVSNVAPGTYTLRATYVGYKSKDLQVEVGAGQNVKLNIKLEAVGVQGKEVVITAQAAGQNAAINQQLSSNQIVNVVSAAKIQELPDANAAESVGRLPGVLVLRSGGEGDEVVIRGLQPKYNEIMVDGVQMGSSDAGTRSVDLSMISSNMLEGIEVSKTVTPDMDASVLGGTVNFEMREAKVDRPGVPKIGLLVQGGYNNLSDAYNKVNNYKYVGSIEDRFLEDKFGVFAQIDIERRNLTSNEMGASYDHQGNSPTQYITTGLNLYDIPRDRLRYNGALVMDYQLPNGKIKFTNFLSTGNTNTQDRNESFNITPNTIDYGLGCSNSKLTTLINGINFQQQLPVFQLNVDLSHAYSETKDPNDWTISFSQTSAGLNGFINTANVNPQAIPKAATYDFSHALLYSLATSSSLLRDRALTGSIDLKTNVNFSSEINAEIKFGGKYRYVERWRTFDYYDGILQDQAFANNLIATTFSIPMNGADLPMSGFIGNDFNYGTFLGGDYKMVAPLSYGMLAQTANLLNKSLDYLAQNNDQYAYHHNNIQSTTNNYSGHENQGAFYAMTIINVGPQLTLIPGVRYQDLRTTYTAPRGIESSESYYNYNHYDTTVTRDHGYWLPDVSLRYKPLSWFDVRLSYTNTLAYPDFTAIVPRIDVYPGQISWINYKLVPSRSTNYDASFSFYENTVGLFTVSGFLKRIDNLIYPWSFHVTGVSALQYYPYSLINSTTVPGNNTVYTFVNDSARINDYGIELDWQTHFWYLPGVLSGLVFSVNYTHIFSKAQYPYTYVKTTGRTPQYIDTSFTDRLVYQPDNVLNLSVGFDYKGFSVRAAMLYQSDIFTGPSFWPQLRANTSAYRRWDLAAKQDLPWYGLQVYMDLNNINGASDISVIQGGGVPTSYQDYGMTADVGLRWRL